MAITLPPLVNGHRYSFASIEVDFGGFVIVAITAINYTDELQPGIIMGSDPNRVGRTIGQRKLTCDFEMYRREWDVFRDALGQSYGRKPFNITIQYAESIGDPVTTDQIIECRIVRVEKSNAEGSDALKVKVVIDPNDIKEGNNSLSLDEVDPPLTPFELGQV